METLVCDYETIDGIIKVNCSGCIFGSSVEDFDVCMARTIDKINEVKKVERIILSERREHEYDYEQTKLLVEIANLYDKLLNEDRVLELSRLGGQKCERCFPKRLAELQLVVKEMLRRDPIGAYVKLKRMIRRDVLKAKKERGMCRECYESYLKNTLIPIKQKLEKTRLIQMVQDKIPGYRIGDRSLYRKIFTPLIRPIFMLTRYMSVPPKGARLVERYKIPNNTTVEIFKLPGKVRFYYHITPPEFRLSDKKHAIIDTARKYLAEHKPSETEFIRPERAREVFMNLGRDMIMEIARGKGIHLSTRELNEMANILARYTAGFGILEVLLADEKLQDIYINSPIGIMPIYVGHGDYEECETNLIPTKEDAESWATRFRMLSGRPLDEANPVLDTELLVPGGRARVCVITRTLSPEGIGYALRRHRDRPWTYPLFIDVKFFNPLFAGLMSFLIDGSRSLLIAGGRSSGKCVSGDTLIQLADGSIKSIRDIVESIFKDQDPVEFEDGEIAVPENLEVLTLDTDLNIRKARVERVWKRNAPNKLIKIRTATGKEIVTTPEHPYFVYDNGRLEKIRADELTVGMEIATYKNKSLAWDGVEIIQEVKPKEPYVYDLTVERTHNFIANGIIAHNTSLLGATMLEIMKKFRVVVCEDTLEIPVPQLRNLGYNIERLKSRSVITRVEAELPAEEALRTALRLGDSCLIIGEVRSVEAKALFEAMRIGALAHVVAGTIHAESAYGVFDRVVNDLGVPKTSFKAIDVVVICGMLRSADGLHRFRRVTELTEIRKHWKEDPMGENAFFNLMEYSAREDKLNPTSTLVNGESYIINEIAKRVKEWHGNWDAVWDNIQLRGKIKQAMVDYARKLNRKDILEAEWTTVSNDMFHMISDQVRKEIGALDSKEIFKRWDEWFRKEIKEKR